MSDGDRSSLPGSTNHPSASEQSHSLAAERLQRRIDSLKDAQSRSQSGISDIDRRAGVLHEEAAGIEDQLKVAREKRQSIQDELSKAHQEQECEPSGSGTQSQPSNVSTEISADDVSPPLLASLCGYC